MSESTKSKRALAGRIRRARKDSGLTQAKAAQALGWPKSRLSDIEAARIPPPEADLVALAKCYGVTVAWLVGLEDAETDRLAARQLQNPRELARHSIEELDLMVAYMRSHNQGSGGG